MALGAAVSTLARHAIRNIPDRGIALGVSVTALGLAPAALAIGLNRRALGKKMAAFFAVLASTAGLSYVCREPRFEILAGYALLSCVHNSGLLPPFTRKLDSKNGMEARLKSVWAGWAYTAAATAIVCQVYFGTLAPLGKRGAVLQWGLILGAGLLYARLDAINIQRQLQRNDTNFAPLVATLLQETKEPRPGSGDQYPTFPNLDLILNEANFGAGDQVSYFATYFFPTLTGCTKPGELLWALFQALRKELKIAGQKIQKKELDAHSTSRLARANFLQRVLAIGWPESVFFLPEFPIPETDRDILEAIGKARNSEGAPDLHDRFVFPFLRGVKSRGAPISNNDLVILKRLKEDPTLKDMLHQKLPEELLSSIG